MMDYNEMIEKMKEATQFKMLGWEKKGSEPNDVFSCFIGRCRVDLSSYYDPVMDDTCYTLSLYNEDGQMFNTLRGSDSGNDGEYASLSSLYKEVRDYYYKITESEKDIMDSLASMIPF